MSTTAKTTTMPTSMTAQMPMYSGNGAYREVLWAVAPHGSIICKRRGTTAWVPAATTMQDIEENLASGKMYRVRDGK